MHWRIKFGINIFFALESKLRKKFDGAANLVRTNKGRTKKKREEDIKVFKKKKEDKDKLAPKKDKDIVRKDFVDQTKKSQSLTPNNILFIENLSSQISEPMLKNLFAQYLGFREVRILSGKGIAFIEYDNEINAGPALVGKDISYIGLNGLQLTPDCVLQISFAKK